MTKDEEALVMSVRAKHHPYFGQLEDAMRKKLPHFDDFAIAFAVCQLIELLDAEEEAALCEANPGLDSLQ